MPPEVLQPSNSHEMTDPDVNDPLKMIPMPCWLIVKELPAALQLPICPVVTPSPDRLPPNQAPVLKFSCPTTFWPLILVTGAPVSVNGPGTPAVTTTPGFPSWLRMVIELAWATTGTNRANTAAAKRD